MKLTFIANACCIYESKGFRLLADPWLTDGAFAGSWFHYPPLKTKAEDFKNVDALYISHLHPDHFDAQTLKVFRRNIPILILANGYLTRMLTGLGFTNLIDIADSHARKIGPFTVTMYAPFVKHPFHDCELGNFIDSAIVIDDGEHQVLNTNDNTPSLEAAVELRERHGHFTLAQLNYNAAGPYPSCFEMPIEEKKAESQRIIERNLTHMTKLIELLQPKYTMPFAGHYVIGGKEGHKNEYLGTTTWDTARHWIQCHARQTEPVVLNEGTTFDLAKGEADCEYHAIDVKGQKDYVETKLKGRKYSYELDPEPSISADELKDARARLWTTQGKYRFFKDFNVYLAVGDSFFSFNLLDGESELTTGFVRLREPYLACYLDLRLLRRILLREEHWNNAEIGCHINFKRQPDIYEPDVHTIMSFFHL